MRYNKKNNKFDACIYKIGIPEHKFHAGKLILRFNIMKNIKINANIGKSIFNAS